MAWFWQRFQQSLLLPLVTNILCVQTQKSIACKQTGTKPSFTWPVMTCEKRTQEKISCVDNAMSTLLRLDHGISGIWTWKYFKFRFYYLFCRFNNVSYLLVALKFPVFVGFVYDTTYQWILAKDSCLIHGTLHKSLPPRHIQVHRSSKL